MSTLFSFGNSIACVQEINLRINTIRNHKPVIKLGATPADFVILDDGYYFSIDIATFWSVWAELFLLLTKCTHAISFTSPLFDYMCQAQSHGTFWIDNMMICVSCHTIICVNDELLTFRLRWLVQLIVWCSTTDNILVSNMVIRKCLFWACIFRTYYTLL